MKKPAQPAPLDTDIGRMIEAAGAHMSGMIAGRAWIEAAMEQGRPLADVMADIAAMLAEADPDVRAHVRGDADMVAILPELPPEIRAAIRVRDRESPLADAVRKAASVLYDYPDGLPDKAALPNGQLCAEIRAYLAAHRMVPLNAAGDAIISDDTILIAVGRKKPPRTRRPQSSTAS
jgi:hypothetical protein